MTKRTAWSILSTALALTLTAPTSHADSSMDACIDAFVAAHVPKERAVTIRKRGASHALSSREERITLTAKGARTGTPIAAATCVVSDENDSITLHEATATIARNAR